MTVPSSLDDAVDPVRRSRRTGGGDGRRDGARRYHSPRRAEQAAATRAAVLAAARELFVAQGYLGTTVADVARQAKVAVDTVYAAVGRKPELLREVLETALSVPGQAVPAGQGEQGAAASARQTIAVYAAAVAETQARLAPIFLALRDAAMNDPACAAQWERIGRRRAASMREFAADLRATGELRPDLSDDDVAAVVWSMNGPEYWVLLVGDRGWSPERFGAFLTDAWTRMLTVTRPSCPDRP